MENNIQPIKNENKEYNHINQSKNEVNKIINNNNEENNKKNKKTHFVSLSNNTIEVWKDILCKNIPQDISFSNYQINANLSEENLNNIKKDVLRTRANESLMYSDYKENLELLICFYCDYNKISYKQGLNEILGALLVLKYKFNLSLELIFHLSQGLINKFVQNYYHEKKIFSLKSSLSLLTLLLKYHKPEIYNLLDKLMIEPIVYATNWLLTMFASRLDLDLTYYLWNFLIGIDDQLFMHYFIIALLIYNEDKILKEEKLNIPILITKLTINSVEEMGNILKNALRLREETPYSFRLLANKLEIFKYHSDDIEKCYEKYKPQFLVTMPIFPSEIFYICYNDIIKCPDDLCIQYLSKNKYKYESQKHVCEHCKMNIDKKIEYILLDLRILEYGSFEDENEKTGFLPKMIMVEQNELKSDDFVEKIKERFLNDKGHYHFIFMTSKTDYFNNFEDNYYIEKQFGNYYKQIKVEKELNEDLIRKMTIRKKFKLKEYDNLKKLLIALLNVNYPYISFCYGGFAAIHELISKFDISLLNHDTNCNLCQKKENSFFDYIKTNFYNKKEHKDELINQEFKMKVIEKIPLNIIYQKIEDHKYEMFKGKLQLYNKENYIKDNECMIIFKEIEIFILRFTNDSFDLDLISVIAINKIHSIERRNALIKIKFNEEKKHFKIKVDLHEEKLANEFINIYEKKKIYVEEIRKKKKDNKKDK